ncbi:MAG TPA: energy transducer TonB [Colwellia sp.]|nr:energy transducer TonB [Colwellia sp.]|tara:strand:+ start:404 stop:1012 length:609 start_codon:yes stop_codon:yes gene_type:complete
MNRIVIITGLSGSITFGLFAFMAFLISNDQVNLVLPPDSVPIDIVSLPDESQAQVKVRPDLNPPSPPPSIPRTRVEPNVGEVNNDFNYSPLKLQQTGGPLSVLSLGNKADGEARPLVRVNPKYPIGAARDGIEGWVVLAFDINTIGEVVNISIIGSQPKRVFDKAAKQALKKWKYKAKSIDGKNINQKKLTVQLDFTMAQSS